MTGSIKITLIVTFRLLVSVKSSDTGVTVTIEICSEMALNSFKDCFFVFLITLQLKNVVLF